MEDFTFGQYRSTNGIVYSAKTLLSSNQFAFISFTEIDNCTSKCFYVCFEIRDKRKYCGLDESKTTGRCGLEGLLWAKKMILKFEKYAIENIRSRYCTGEPIDMSINVGWADSRRKRVYMWGLQKCGYRLYPNEKCLVKKLY